MKLFLFCLCKLSVAMAFQHFGTEIPNGIRVPNPGPQGGVWAGVGHVNTGGGGDLNPFGIDFAAAGFAWTQDLCSMDSDGDGRSNGQELGDPNCAWEAGLDPEFPASGHPGIVDEAQEQAISACDSYIAPNTTYEWDISFTAPNDINETQTHYRCEQYDLPVPSSEMLHQVKSKVLLDNAEVLHHMFIFICLGEASDGNRVGEGPYECDGNESKCLRIGGWAVGPEEQCFPNNVGAEMDFRNVKQLTVKVEAHYDNTSGQTQQDKSGIQVTLTPELRPLAMGSMIVGTDETDANFVLPPRQTKYSLVNICPGEATMKMDRPVYAFQWNPHMHLYGKTMVTEQYRCGKKIGEIGRIESYEFDNQQTYDFRQYMKILPGDALVTTCEFDTSSTDTQVVGGEATTDEMCLNFITFYPSLRNDLLSACIAFENGVRDDFDDRIAIVTESAEDWDSILLKFESDPVASSLKAPCCKTNSCESMFVANEGEPCGVSSDCVDNVECLEGCCGFCKSNLSGGAVFGVGGALLAMIITSLIHY